MNRTFSFSSVVAGLVAGAVVAACGASSGTPAGDENLLPGAQATLTIQNLTFVPDNLTVAPGTTITIHNRDPFPHSVTSQSVKDAYTPGAVNGVSFDTGHFQGDATITIPAEAPSGTVVPCFCTVHKGAMKNDCQITIQ